MRRLLPALPWLLLLLGAADLVALKAGALQHRPAVLAAVFAAAGLAFLARVVQLVGRGLRARSGRIASLAEAVVSLGLLAALGGGMTNWLLGLQGFVILMEGEVAHLREGAQLQAFAGGPLARLEEMDLQLVLDEVELVATGPGQFFPLSRLRVWRRGEEPQRLEVAPHRWAASGPLRFHQGAFGFAPRVVVLEGSGRTVIDQVVPFVTRRQGPAGISFTGSLDLENEQLQIAGAVDLESLDEGMRGHAQLQLTVDRKGSRLGQGSLLPGHFADLEDGYRVGFAGLEKWSEIVVSRRSYGEVVLVGLAVALAAAVVWSLALWRGW